MPSIAKKIIATVTLVASAVMMASPAAALTAEELQAQINSLLATIASLQAQLAQVDGGSSTGTVAGCTISSFTTNLTIGSRGEDVKCLQIILNSSTDTQLASTGAGSPGNETTYFGPITKTAVIKFQNKYASEVLTPLGLSAGTGYVGSSTRAKLDTMISTGTVVIPDDGETTTPVGGTNEIELASNNPAASTVAKGAQNVPFMKANVCAGSQANTISRIIITRTGIAADTDIANIKLYDGTTQIGATQALNTTNHKATFSGLNWTIPANTCKVLTVKASIAAGAGQGNAPALSIAAASDITSTVALTGFPVQSNSMAIANVATGEITTTEIDSPTGTILAGAVEQAIASFRFTAATETIDLHAITLTKSGSAIDADISNIKVFQGATQIGPTVSSLISGKATVDFSDTPVNILNGASKTLTVYADLGTSIGISSRNVVFEIAASTDVIAYGSNSGGQVSVAGTYPVPGETMSIALGSLTVGQDLSYSPSAQNYARGTMQNDIVAFKFTAGADEGVRVTQIKLTEANTSLLDTDISNISLYDAETGELVAGSATQMSGYVTFGYNSQGLDSSGLFDIAKSESKTIIVRADVSASAVAASGILGYKINAAADVKADGLSSMNDLAAPTLGTTGVGLKHTIIEKGTLTIGPSSASPAAATYSVGTTNFIFAKFDLTSTGENMVVSQLNVYFSTDTSATSTTAASADINNAKLYDGSTLKASDNVVSSGYANFSPNLTVAKNTTKTVTVIADIPTGSTAESLKAWVITADDVTATGEDSGADITVGATSWDAVSGKLMKKGTPALTITAAAVPAARTFIKNSTNNLVTTLYFTAGTAEDLQITRIRVAGDATTATPHGTLFTEAATDTTGYDVKSMVSNVKLYVGSTQIGSTVATMLDGTNYDYADFSGLSLLIPKGTIKAIDVKLDVVNNASGPYYYFGVATDTDITGTGYNSGKDLSGSVTVNAQGEIGKNMTFGSAGSLAVAQAAETAIAATYVAGDSKVTMGSWRFTGSNEEINLSMLKFDVNHSSNATGTSVGYASASTVIEALDATATYAFDYSIDDGTAATCSFEPATDTAASWADAINADCTSLVASESAGVFTLYASSSADDYSLEIRDASSGTNVADKMKLGLKYGGTETVGRVAGASQNIGAVYLYDGSDVYTSYPVSNTVTFNIPSGSEIEVPVGNKTLTLKVDLSMYTSLLEGSTLKFTLGSATNSYDDTYITAKGASSGTTLGNDDINGTSPIGALATSEMWLYATKPILSLNAKSPSGAKVPNANQEVFIFDVTNPHPSISLNINAVRFTISNSATDSLWGKTFNLYKSTDLTTSLGSGVAKANADTDTTGWVVIYPTSGSAIGADSYVTYVLKGNTSGMNVTTGNDLLSVSIEDADFYWDDNYVANANQKVSGMPVQGNTLSY